MDEDYKSIHRQADKLHHKCKDLIDDQSNPLARLLERETMEVREDIEQNKEPRSVEDRIKRLQRELERAKDQETGAISPQDADHLFDEYEQMRGDLRGLSNY